jgi:hypothetical protein
MRAQTFVTWINSILAARNMEVVDLERDFSDGVKLINLIELLSGTPPPPPRLLHWGGVDSGVLSYRVAVREQGRQ